MKLYDLLQLDDIAVRKRLNALNKNEFTIEKKKKVKDINLNQR